MILLRRVRKILLTIGLVLFISTAIAFSFASEDSWATTSFTQHINQLHARLATMDQAKGMAKDVEGKAQAAIGNMTGDPNNQAAGEAKQFAAKTQAGNNNSIVNPDYQLSGRTKQAEKQTREATEDVKAKVRDAF